MKVCHSFVHARCVYIELAFHIIMVELLLLVELLLVDL